MASRRKTRKTICIWIRRIIYSNDSSTLLMFDILFHWLFPFKRNISFMNERAKRLRTNRTSSFWIEKRVPSLLVQAMPIYVRLIHEMKLISVEISIFGSYFVVAGSCFALRPRLGRQRNSMERWTRRRVKHLISWLVDNNFFNFSSRSSWVNKLQSTIAQQDQYQTKNGVQGLDTSFP